MLRNWSQCAATARRKLWKLQDENEKLTTEVAKLTESEKAARVEEQQWQQKVKMVAEERDKLAKTVGKQQLQFNQMALALSP